MYKQKWYQNNYPLPVSCSEINNRHGWESSDIDRNIRNNNDTHIYNIYFADSWCKIYIHFWWGYIKCHLVTLESKI